MNLSSNDVTFESDRSSNVLEVDSSITSKERDGDPDQGGLANEAAGIIPHLNTNDFDRTRTAILQHISSFPDYPTQERAIGQAQGRVLVDPVVASSEQPRFDQSEKNGYAILSDEFSGTGPWRFSVTEPSSAGRHTAEGAYKPRSAINVMTGHLICAPYDCVVPTKDVVLDGDQISIARGPVKGTHMVKAGQTFSENTPLLNSNHMLDPRDIALLAANGTSSVKVRRKLRVSLLSIGDELTDAGSDLEPSNIYDTNRPMITAALALPWITLQDDGIILDEVEALRLRLRLSVPSTDVLVITGGISDGSNDHLRKIIEGFRGTIWANEIGTDPKKSVLIGKIGDTLILALPGDPACAYMALQVLGIDILRARVGLKTAVPQQFLGYANFDHENASERTKFLLVKQSSVNENGMAVLDLVDDHGLTSLWSLAQSDGYLRVDPEHKSIQAGDTLWWTQFSCTSA